MRNPNRINSMTERLFKLSNKLSKNIFAALSDNVSKMVYYVEDDVVEKSVLVDVDNVELDDDDKTLVERMIKIWSMFPDMRLGQLLENMSLSEVKFDEKMSYKEINAIIVEALEQTYNRMSY